ncbi:hypothetical protein BDR03DRAFT_1012057 [Suillus americanus]|nr:hypothetical protein BDR03DRAFT_1012057 [Suillus americanus]
MSPPPTSESWRAILDAHLAQPRPDFLHECENCHEEVPWARCKSNKKGNKGCWYAMCKKVAGEEPTKCTFFCWASGPSSLPMPSPEIPQGSPQLHPVVVQPSTLSNVTLLFICATLHCGILGGCSVKDHGPAAMLDPHLELQTYPAPAMPAAPSPSPAPVPATLLHSPAPIRSPPPTLPIIAVTPHPSSSSTSIPDFQPPVDKGKG